MSFSGIVYTKVQALPTVFIIAKHLIVVFRYIWKRFFKRILEVGLCNIVVKLAFVYLSAFFGFALRRKYSKRLNGVIDNIRLYPSLITIP